MLKNSEVRVRNRYKDYAVLLTTALRQRGRGCRREGSTILLEITITRLLLEISLPGQDNFIFYDICPLEHRIKRSKKWKELLSFVKASNCF